MDDQKKVTELYHTLHSHLPSEPALRVKTIQSLLVEKGLIQEATIDSWVQAYSEDIGPRRGAEVIAKAWLEPDFKQALLADAAQAVDELGLMGKAVGHLKAVENTDAVHNMVVCTLCSCYPFALLGIAPDWYKKAAYRSRAVREPRQVLREFGVELADEITVRVYDSTAELRYLVIPQRPAGTEDFTAAQLADLVTRNAMIGTQRELSVEVA